MKNVMLKKSGRIKSVPVEQKHKIAKLKADGFVEVVQTKDGLKEIKPETIEIDKLKADNAKLKEQVKTLKAKIKKLESK